MAAREVRFHPAAVEEAAQAHRWYADRSSRAALAFGEALDFAVHQLSAHPNRWAKYLHGTRHLLL
jgi:uncharacterized protein with PIN domain